MEFKDYSIGFRTAQIQISFSETFLIFSKVYDEKTRVARKLLIKVDRMKIWTGARDTSDKNDVES
jgi:hypothetical protein